MNKTGWENASPNLFEHRTTFITPLKDTPDKALEILSEFWQRLGAQTVIIPPETHDQIVAYISHLPQIVATTLVDALLTQDPAWPAYSGGGLRDTTRIAASDPAMWLPILKNNREAILNAIWQYQYRMESFKKALEENNWEMLQTIFQKARDFRQTFPQ